MLEETVLEGTLKPDGTLELDEVPELPAGRVTIVLRTQQLPSKSSSDWWSYAQQCREILMKSNTRFMSDEEVQKHIESLDDDDQNQPL